MTKMDLVEDIHEKAQLSKKEAAELVELVFDLIKDALAAGKEVKISRFGNFKVRKKRSRVGRNPQTGDVIEIAARQVLTFKASQVLKMALNVLSVQPREQINDPK